MSISPEENIKNLDYILEKNSIAESVTPSPSQDLTDVINIESSYSGQDLVPSELEIHGKNLISEFEAAQKVYSTKVFENVSNSLVNSLSNREEYIRARASQLYTEIHKAAKKFIKNWCIINSARQIWSNPFAKPFAKEFNSKFLRRNSEFIPQVYSLSIKLSSGEIKPLIYMAKTAREASINGAKLLGFDDSNEKKLIFAMFPWEEIQIILNNPKYLKEQEALYIYQEHREQILSRNYIPDSIREKWNQILQDEFAKKNGVI